MYNWTVTAPIAKATIDSIMAMPEWKLATPGKVMGGKSLPGRNGSIAWAPWGSPLLEMMEMYATIGNKAFLLDNFAADVESVQLTQYEKDQGYVWHSDTGSTMHSFHSRRRISITVQLTDPSEYEGGVLQLYFGHGETFDMPKQQGAVIMFPSYVIHQVTPVTRGVRRSVVSWVR